MSKAEEYFLMLDLSSWTLTVQAHHLLEICLHRFEMIFVSFHKLKSTMTYNIPDLLMNNFGNIFFVPSNILSFYVTDLGGISSPGALKMSAQYL